MTISTTIIRRGIEPEEYPSGIVDGTTSFHLESDHYVGGEIVVFFDLTITLCG